MSRFDTMTTKPKSPKRKRGAQPNHPWKRQLYLSPAQRNLYDYGNAAAEIAMRSGTPQGL